MPHYRQVGDIPRKRHIQMRRPDGGLYSEELMGEDGFSSDSSLLYHRHLPTAICRAEVAPDVCNELVPNHPLLPKHFKTHALAVGGDIVRSRQLLVGNDDVHLRYVVADQTSGLYRNAVGDEVVYIESGTAILESVFGTLRVGEGDHVIIPTSTTHRWVVEQGEVRALVVESRGHIRPPHRYLSQFGQLLENAPYSERDLRAPCEVLVVDDPGEVDVLVRHRGGMTTLTYQHHPFDVVGWDGYLYPYVFNINDFEPVVGRIHMPPPVHQTFEGPNFVMCAFCPRPFDFDPQAIPVPYNHANVDSDEVLFYVGGNFMSRRKAGIELGSMSLHPAGFVHGPQPGSVEASLGQAETNELAVMVDTFRPLSIGPAAQSAEDPAYPWTWSTDPGK